MAKSPLLALLFALGGCAAQHDAERVELQVWTDGEGLGVVTTDLGYEVELERATVIVEHLRFSLAGEAHASLWRTVSVLMVPEAHAHPGHDQGGEVTGELPGHFVLRFTPRESHALGTATLLVGKYQSASFTFAHASAEDAGGDGALSRQTAVLRGTATTERAVTAFEFIVDSPVGRELVGIPFEHHVNTGAKERLMLRLLTEDPLEGDTLFDGVDFSALDSDGDGAIQIAATAEEADIVAAHNRMRRVFQSHDHFLITTEP